jgi:nucleoid-associated protein YgaU
VGWRPAKPDRPIAPPADIGLVSTSPTVGRSPDEEVVVRRSDTLWSIAARHLGDHASAAEIAHEWPRWFAANRPVIGADPDRLVPGQRLVPPR